MNLQIELHNISKKYSNHFILKDFSYTFSSGNSYAILGSNGSGKSTLIKLLSGLYSATVGIISFKQDEKIIPADQVFNHVSLAAPWSDVVDDFTLRECISFQFKFRKSLEGITVKDIISISGLETSADKFINQYSSGMKQRVRLLLAFFTQSDVLLLDEPTSNLDAAGKQWYRSLIEKYSDNRLIIVASNHLAEEYDFCKKVIELK